MKKSFSFICATCGVRHDGSPSFAFDAPEQWSGETSDTTGVSKLHSDLCVIESRDFFIKAVLEIPIAGADEPFSWGVWVSQSEGNLRTYAESLGNSPEKATFGYFANRLPGYPDTLNLRTLAHWRPDGQRPLLELEESDHHLFLDWRHGITWERAIEIASIMRHH